MNLTQTISTILFSVGMIGYAVTQLQIFGKLKWQSRDNTGFWGASSWLRKYKNWQGMGQIGSEKAPDNWYYRTFNIPFKERFPGSATIFVMFTDGYHLVQFFSLRFMNAALCLHTAHFWLNFAILWFVTSWALTGVFKFLSK